MNNNTEENSINENDLPVLEPPPGFEDECMFSVNDHYYDDPYSEGEEDDSECKLILDVANKFAESMVESIFSLVFQPRVKLRSKKSPTRETPPQSIFGNDEYSVPIDSLINRKHKESRTMTVGHARHSIAVPNSDSSEPIHMTLEEVRCYLQEFEGNTSRTRPWMFVPSKSVDVSDSKRKTCFFWTPEEKKRNRKSLSVTAAGIKQALFSVFRIPSHHHLPHGHADSSSNQVCPTGWTFSLPDKSSGESTSPHQRRALPPLPQEPVGFVRVPRSTPIQHLDLARDIVDNHDTFEASINSLSEGNLDVSSSSNNMDFAASIEEVKDHGWYWGPLSGEAAEKILSNEPDGSFLVRDSSDDHYIFSLSFKLNGGVRHVRIEHDHGIWIFFFFFYQLFTLFRSELSWDRCLHGSSFGALILICRIILWWNSNLWRLTLVENYMNYYLILRLTTSSILPDFFCLKYLRNNTSLSVPIVVNIFSRRNLTRIPRPRRKCNW